MIFIDVRRIFHDDHFYKMAVAAIPCIMHHVPSWAQDQEPEPFLMQWGQIKFAHIALHQECCREGQMTRASSILGPKLSSFYSPT